MSENNNGVEIIIRNALDLASTEGHEYVTLEHLTLCLLDDDQIKNIAEQLEVEIDVIKNDINNTLTLSFSIDVNFVCLRRFFSSLLEKTKSPTPTRYF